MNDDTISRQAAIDAIEQHKTAVLGSREWDEGIGFGYAAAHRHLVDIVKQLPSAERRGRWKPFDLTWGRSVYTCTACGESFEVPTEWGEPMYRFCPNCGAKMDEVSE